MEKADIEEFIKKEVTRQLRIEKIELAERIEKELRGTGEFARSVYLIDIAFWWAKIRKYTVLSAV